MEPDLISSPIITGIGLTTPLGRNATETWDALVAGRSLANHACVPGYSGPHRVMAMAQAAATQALTQARWTPTDRANPNTALFVGTSKGDIESWTHPLLPPPPVHRGPWRLSEAKSRVSGAGEGACAQAAHDFSDNSPRVFLGLSSLEVYLARTLNFGPGPRLTISSACSSGLHALIRAAMAIQSGEAARVLVVAAEASVQPIFISSFNRLGVLAPEGHGCRPFDQNRSGFTITEAAAAVCLESAKPKSDSRGVNTPMIQIDQYATAADATHLTANDPDAKILRRVLARMHTHDFDLIHAHATATAVNDPSELAAIQTIAGNSNPILYSHKGALGHSLGAAGLISVVINCLCHQHGRIPGNIHSTHPLPTPGFQFTTKPIDRPIRRSLALAAGFGGPIAAISLVSNL